MPDRWWHRRARLELSADRLTAPNGWRTALQQGLISYLFGAVMIALVINIVASLI
jgi:uncharacterized membrane protein